MLTPLRFARRLCSPNKDAFLLTIVEGLDEPGGWCHGGSGGSAGRHGSAGQGGDGGPGGKPFHWQTEHWDPRQVHHSEVRDEEGKVTQKAYTETVYDKRIEHHTTPGGSQGPRGPAGHGPTRSVYGGSNGRAGVISINMDGMSYQRRYELSVASFEVVAVGTPATPHAASDGIFEFGECCHVQKVKLGNKAGAGRAPSPAHQRVRVRLDPNRWVTKVSGDVFCSESIQAGTISKDVQGVMPFQIACMRDARSNTPRQSMARY